MAKVALTGDLQAGQRIPDTDGVGLDPFQPYDLCILVPSNGDLLLSIDNLPFPDYLPAFPRPFLGLLSLSYPRSIPALRVVWSSVQMGSRLMALIIY